MVGKRSRASNLLLEDTFDHLNEGIALFDQEDRLVVFNGAYAKLFESLGFFLKPGITVNDIAAAGLFSLYEGPEAGPTEPQLTDPEMVEYHAARGLPILRQSKDGRVLSVVYSRTSEGGMVVSWTDVTEQQQYLQTLKEREEDLRKTLETVSEGVIGIDEHGTIDSYNSAAEQIFGYEPAEMIGRNVSMLMPEPDSSAHDGYIARYLDTGDARIIGIGREVVGCRKSGETFPMALAIGEMQTSRSVRFIGTIRDISKTREIEAQLRHSEKMKAIGQLTEGIAHEFNNLLTVILGNLRNLEGRDDIPAAASKPVAAALRATRQAGDLTQRLLDFSHRTPWQPKRIDPGEAVGDVIEMLTPVLGQKISLQARIARDTGDIRVDPAQLQNALVNLAINSRDAMSGCGDLYFTVRRATLEERERSASVLTNIYEVVVIEIEDDGPGMTPDVIDRAVEPFFTTKEIGEGSGLGLSMVYSFVEQSGGDMQIESQPGVRTVVTLLLPAAQLNTPLPSQVN